MWSCFHLLPGLGRELVLGIQKLILLALAVSHMPASRASWQLPLRKGICCLWGAAAWAWFWHAVIDYPIHLAKSKQFSRLSPDLPSLRQASQEIQPLIRLSPVLQISNHLSILLWKLPIRCLMQYFFHTLLVRSWPVSLLRRPCLCSGPRSNTSSLPLVISSPSSWPWRFHIHSQPYHWPAEYYWAVIVHHYCIVPEAEISVLTSSALLSYLTARSFVLWHLWAVLWSLVFWLLGASSQIREPSWSCYLTAVDVFLFDCHSSPWLRLPVRPSVVLCLELAFDQRGGHRTWDEYAPHWRHASHLFCQCGLRSSPFGSSQREDSPDSLGSRLVWVPSLAALLSSNRWFSEEQLSPPVMHWAHRVLTFSGRSLLVENASSLGASIDVMECSKAGILGFQGYPSEICIGLSDIPIFDWTDV